MEAAALFLRSSNSKRWQLQRSCQVLTRFISNNHNCNNSSKTFLLHNVNLQNRRMVFNQHSAIISKRYESTNKPPDNKPPSLSEKLKQAVKEYGSTVIVFHVTISLMSLGTCYLLLSSGLDITKILTPLGISDETLQKITSNKLATNAGTFAIAYAVHKVFAPARIVVTLTATPFIVTYLRRIGFIAAKK